MRVPNLRTVSGQDAYELFWSLCRELRASGVWVDRRGQQCLELVGPTTIRLRDPAAYAPLHPYRKLNPWSMLAEFPWLMEGRSDVGWLLPYLPGAANFSDDGLRWRAGYGPRMRQWGLHKPTGYMLPTSQDPVDQVQRVIAQLTRDQFTRQAVISFWDPVADSVDGSRDYPCTQTVHFMCAPDGHLDCYVHMRSNDLFWGFSGVNVPNFCLLQQLVAAASGLEVGDYYHMADNLHIYDRHRDALELTAEAGLPSCYPPGRWPSPHMQRDELVHLSAAVHAVEHFRQRTQTDVDPQGLANFMQGGAHVDGYSVQWAHFMLMWDLVNDTPRRRAVNKRPGDALAVRLDKAMADVDCKMWRLAAAMWMMRSSADVNVSLGTQHMRDILGRSSGFGLAYTGAIVEQDTPKP